jgi:hypothetical protein
VKKVKNVYEVSNSPGGMTLTNSASPRPSSLPVPPF